MALSYVSLHPLTPHESCSRHVHCISLPMKKRGGEIMTAIFIILVWLLIAFVVGVTFGKFCAAGNGLDTRCLSKLDIKFDTLVDNLTPIEDQAEEVA